MKGLIKLADFSRESMLDMFIFEMNQLLDQLEQLIIECEDGYSMDNINEIFRIMHTVKGSAAMMMFDDVSKTAHAVEDLFFYLREENPSDVNYSNLTDVVLEGMDFIKNELAKISQGEEADTDSSELIKRIKGFLSVLKGESPEGEEPKTQEKTTNQPIVEEKTLEEEKFLNKFECHLFFEEESGMENIRSFNVLNNLKSFGEILSCIPKDVTAVESEEFIKKEGFKFLIGTDLQYEQIHEAISSTIYLKNFELVAYKTKKYKATIYFEDGCEMENVRSYTVAHNLKEFAENIITEPEDLMLEENIDVIRNTGFKVEFSTNKEYEEVNEILNQTVFLKSLELKELKEEEAEEIEKAKSENNEPKIENVKEEPKKEVSKKDSSNKAKDNKKASSTQQMISVSIGKLDQLLNLMGELVISEAMTTQNPDLDGLELENFNKSARQLRKIIKDVQDNVMSMRMVTLDATFFKMQRIVRDMC
ncbi:MAG: Hpt domain-containing protein, partial [Eubacteriales bacterium]|nr:Hpt domain-containing protein [Eubacteriales bacterium]